MKAGAHQSIGFFIMCLYSFCDMKAETTNEFFILILKMSFLPDL